MVLGGGLSCGEEDEEEEQTVALGHFWQSEDYGQRHIRVKEPGVFRKPQGSPRGQQAGLQWDDVPHGAGRFMIQVTPKSSDFPRRGSLRQYM